MVGDIKFGPNGEWTEPRVLEVQFRGVTGHDVDQFKDAKTEVVLWPPALQTGTLQSPYDGAALTRSDRLAAPLRKGGRGRVPLDH